MCGPACAANTHKQTFAGKSWQMSGGFPFRHQLMRPPLAVRTQQLSRETHSRSELSVHVNARIHAAPPQRQRSRGEAENAARRRVGTRSRLTHDGRSLTRLRADTGLMLGENTARSLSPSLPSLPPPLSPPPPQSTLLLKCTSGGGLVGVELMHG